VAPALTLPLRNSVYRRLFSAQIVGLLGTGISTVALGLLAFSMGGGNAGQILGVVLALKVATYVLVSPAIAAFAAGVSRKKLLVTMDVVRALAIGSIAFVGEIWQVYVLIVIVSAASAGFTPAFQALIPDIFTDVDTYTEALSLSRLAYELEALVSPLIAGLLLAVVGYTELFTLNSLAFLTSAGLVLTTAVPAVRDDALAARKLSQVSQGIRQFLRTPRLQGLFLLDWAAAAAGAMVLINTVIYVKGQLGFGDSDVAWALGAFGAGSIVIALLLPTLLRRFTDRSLMLLGGLILAASMFLFVAVGSLTTLMACWALAGIGTSAVLTPSGRLIQRSGDSAGRPALFAAQFSLSHFCWLFTYLIAGFAGEALGLSEVALILGAIAAGASVLAAMVWRPEPPARQASSTGSPQRLSR